MTETYFDGPLGKTIKKDPDATLDYTFDWNDTDGPWLAVGETISSHVVTVASGLTKDSDSEFGGKVTVILSGGTAGTKANPSTYKVSCKITTDSVPARIDERSIFVNVVER